MARFSFSLGVVITIAVLVVSTRAEAQCPPIPTPAQVADPNAGVAPAAPTQATTIQRSHVDFGDSSYCLYHPPAGVTRVGVLLYNHGAQLSETGLHDPMAQWLASIGYYVVYPYIPDAFHYASDAKASLEHAILVLAIFGIQTEHVAVAGFSLGGLAAVRVAAIWDHQEDYPIEAIVLHDPAGLDFLPFLNTYGEYDITQAGLASIPCDTRLLIIQAQSSVGQTNSGAMPIWNALPQIARYAGTSGTSPNRNFLRVRDDVSHQSIPPNLVLPSNHEVVTATPLTSMDWYGYWLPTFGATFEAFYDSPFWGYSPLCNTSSTTGTCSLARNMGNWAIDGLPATTMRNAADLGIIASFPSYCGS